MLTIIQNLLFIVLSSDIKLLILVGSWRILFILLMRFSRLAWASSYFIFYFNRHTTTYYTSYLYSLLLLYYTVLYVYFYFNQQLRFHNIHIFNVASFLPPNYTFNGRYVVFTVPGVVKSLIDQKWVPIRHKSLGTTGLIIKTLG